MWAGPCGHTTASPPPPYYRNEMACRATKAVQMEDVGRAACNGFTGPSNMQENKPEPGEVS